VDTLAGIGLENAQEDSAITQDVSGPARSKQAMLTSNEVVREFWSMVQADHPDRILLRFLRARKWQVDKAFQMLVDTIKWRLEWNVKDIVAQGEFNLKTELLNAPGKSYFRNHDKEGRPIWYVECRLFDCQSIANKQ
jgi:hypothetical protein